MFLVSEILALENRNWLIHFHFSRREFGICNILIKDELTKSEGMNEYANYIQVTCDDSKNLLKKEIFPKA